MIIKLTSNPRIGDTFTLTNRQHTFVFVKQRRRRFQVTKGKTPAQTRNNLADAINRDPPSKHDEVWFRIEKRSFNRETAQTTRMESA